MSEILWLVVLTVFCGWIIDKRNYAYYVNNSYKRDQFFTFFICIILCVFCGLRTWYNDTVTYIQIYEQTPSLSEFWGTKDASLSRGLGFGVLNCILKDMGLSVQDYLMFYAFCSVAPCIYFIRRYSTSFTLSLFLLFTTGYYLFNFAAIKQCVATAICLCSIGFALERKWLRFVLLIGLAVLFHPYAIIYIIVPFMIFPPGTRKTFFYVALFVGAGFLLESLLGVVLNVTDMIGADYSGETFSGEGVSVFRVMVCFVPMFLAMISKFRVFLHSSKEDWLIFNLAMVNGLIMFIGLFGTANYFGRLANYFLPIQTIAIPWLAQKMDKKNRRWIILLCIIGYSLYFYYENGILRPFDSSHTGITLFDYLGSLF